LGYGKWVYYENIARYRIFRIFEKFQREIRDYETTARKNIRNLVFKYKTVFDILSAPTEKILNRKEFFY